MKKTLKWVLILSVTILGTGRLAGAQFFYPGGMGFAGGGWEGWSSTAYGDIARGMGVYAAGAGVYNYKSAVAQSIDTDTMMRWNQYLFESQQETNRRYARLQAERSNRRNEAFNARQIRLRDNPSTADVFRGDALNVLLDDLSNPRLISGSSLRTADQKVSGRLIRAIPFFHASDAVTLSLDRLTDVKSWPAVLRRPEYQAEREAFFKAVKVVVAEDEEGDPVPADVAKVRSAVKALYAKVTMTIPVANRLDFVPATNFVKGLAGLARLMEKPKFEKVLEDLDPARQATVGQLLGFMQNFNLRFGVATDPNQRAAYTELFKMLPGQRTRLLANAKEAPAPANIQTSPADLFKNVPAEVLMPETPAAR